MFWQMLALKITGWLPAPHPRHPFHFSKPPLYLGKTYCKHSGKRLGVLADPNMWELHVVQRISFGMVWPLTLNLTCYLGWFASKNLGGSR